MKKWIVIIILLALVLAGWAGFDIVSDIRSDYDDGLAQAEALAIETTGWQRLERYRYHGEAPYYIFTMIDEEDVAYYVIVDENHQVNYVPQHDLPWDEERLKQHVLEEYHEWMIRTIRPAYLEQGLCWEVVASDAADQWHYLYYGMEDGKFIKRYTLENNLRPS